MSFIPELSELPLVMCWMHITDPVLAVESAWLQEGDQVASRHHSGRRSWNCPSPENTAMLRCRAPWYRETVPHLPVHTGTAMTYASY